MVTPMSVAAELQAARGALRDADLRAGAGRVRPRARARGSGTPRARSTSTSSPASRSTTPATATRGSSTRSPSRRRASRAPRTSTTPSRRCGSPSGSSESSLGGKVFLCNSGTEANECAIKLVRKRAHARGIERARDRHPRRTPSTAARSGALAATPKLAREDLFGPLPPGFVAVPRDDPEALRAAVGERHRGGDDRADPGRGRGLPDRRRGARRRRARPATGPARCSSSTRSRPGWGGPGRCGPTSSSRVRPDVITARQGARRRPAGRRRGDRAGARRRARARRPRLDLRRRPGRRSGGAGGARRDRRRELLARVADARRALARRARGARRVDRGPRTRPDGRRHAGRGPRRRRRRRAGARRAASCSTCRASGCCASCRR